MRSVVLQRTTTTSQLQYAHVTGLAVVNDVLIACCEDDAFGASGCN
ncbi:MAG: hypothetical protein ABI885_05675 [Gammaproteobacteria bacterium]